MTNFHDNKDWNYTKLYYEIMGGYLYDQLPWQQGLKLYVYDVQVYEDTNFMTNFNDNKDWNIILIMFKKNNLLLYDQLPWQQGLKRNCE